MKNLLRIAVVALALSCFQAYGTYVCTSKDAEREARQRWSGTIKEIIYDPDREGYWIVMTYRGGVGEQIKYISDDCEWYISPEEAERRRQIEQD